MPLSRIRRAIFSFVTCQGTWAALVASTWAFSQDLRLGNLKVAIILATCPALAVLLGTWQMRLLLKPTARIYFLIVTLIGAASVALFMEGQAENAFRFNDIGSPAYL